MTAKDKYKEQDHWQSLTGDRQWKLTIPLFGKSSVSNVSYFVFFLKGMHDIHNYESISIV